MTGWKNICCAVDLSEPSRVAMLKAAELSRRFEGNLVLVYVHPFAPTLGTNMLAAPQDFAELQVEEIEETMARWRVEAEHVAGRPVRSVVLSGDAATEILGFARERECDVLVVATHGRKGLSRLVLGSVAEKIVRTATCSVMVARPTEPATARAVFGDAKRSGETAMEG